MNPLIGGFDYLSTIVEIQCRQKDSSAKIQIHFYINNDFLNFNVILTKQKALRITVKRETMKVKFELVDKYMLVNEPANKACEDLRILLENYEDVFLDNVSFNSFQAKIAYVDSVGNGDFMPVDFQLFDPIRTSGFQGYIAPSGWTHWLNAYIDEPSGLLGAVDCIEFQEISEDDMSIDEVGGYVYNGKEKLELVITDNDENIIYSESWMDELVDEADLSPEEVARVAECTHRFCDKGTKFNEHNKYGCYTVQYYKKVNEQK